MSHPLRALLRAVSALSLVLPLVAAAPAADSSRVPAPADTGRAAASATTAAPKDSVAKPQRKGAAQMIAEADSAVKARGGARADSAELFLSWDAPWGKKRAKRERMPACSDSTREDTLYLCMRPGRTSERFLAFSAELTVHSTGTDTLGKWWHMQGKGGFNPGSMRVDWAPSQEEVGTPPLFDTQGQGFVVLEPGRSAARLRLLYAVPMTDAKFPVSARTTYCLARIVLKHKPARGLAGCESPVAIEWNSSTLTFGLKDEPRVARGSRLVSFSGPYSITAPFQSTRAPAWKPPANTKR